MTRRTRSGLGLPADYLRGTKHRYRLELREILPARCLPWNLRQKPLRIGSSKCHQRPDQLSYGSGHRPLVRGVPLCA
jgi:hypothetical protein